MHENRNNKAMLILNYDRLQLIIGFKIHAVGISLIWISVLSKIYWAFHVENIEFLRNNIEQELKSSG